MQLVSKLALNFLWIAVAAFILAASAVSAQTYPGVVGSVTAAAADTTPAPGSSVQVSGMVADGAGNPVRDATVNFTITSNPGAASFENGQQSIAETTNEAGVATATLNTGRNPGTIVVRVDASGVVSQVTLTTAGPQALPQTGGSPTAPGGVLPATVLAAFGAALAIFAAAAAGLLVRLRSRHSGRRTTGRYSV